MSNSPAPSTARRSLNPLDRFAKNRKDGVVIEAELVTPTMKRVRIACDRLADMTFVPGQHFRIEINDPLSLYGIFRPSETLRTYSIWDFDQESTTFEIRGHLYEGDGIGLRWLHAVKKGDTVPFWGPLGDLALTPDAPYHLFAGDETGSAAFGPLLRALGPDEKVYGVLESETPDDDVPVPGPHTLGRVHRRGASPVASRVLADAVAALDLPDTPGVAYIAGEARTGQAIRNYLVQERGWERTAITVKPFWTPGKKGLHH